MTAVGGITRLTHSGLSMVHWSFTGSLPPLNELAWQAEFQRYQLSPEFIEINNRFTLAEFKSIYWWEYIHRLLGRFIGFVFIVPFVFFWWRGAIPKHALPYYFVLLGCGLAQALLGWYMVQSGLIDVPRVSQYRLAAHLLTAFFTCSCIYWTVLRTNSGFVPLSRISGWWLAIGALLWLQVFFGAMVAGLKAGFAHNTWPLMDGHWIHPAAVDTGAGLWHLVTATVSGSQFVHRTLALLLLAVVAYGLFKPRLRSTHLPLAIALAFQVVLGVATLLLVVPTWLAVFHQAMALLTLLVWLRTAHALVTNQA